MLGITAAVGVVAADRDVALVIEGSVPGRTAPRSGLARTANAPSVMLPLRHPFDRNLPARQRQIGLGALGMLGGGTQDLGAHLLRGGMRSVTGDHRAAAVERAHAPMKLIGGSK